MIQLVVDLKDQNLLTVQEVH